LTNPHEYVIVKIMEKERDFRGGNYPLGQCATASLSEGFKMSCIYNEILLENLYEEALEICTKRMSVIGSYPWEIKAAAEEMAIEMFEERGL
jgi:hypothetical protein